MNEDPKNVGIHLNINIQINIPQSPQPGGTDSQDPADIAKGTLGMGLTQMQGGTVNHTAQAPSEGGTGSSDPTGTPNKGSSLGGMR